MRDRHARPTKALVAVMFTTLATLAIAAPRSSFAQAAPSPATTPSVAPNGASSNGAPSNAAPSNGASSNAAPSSGAPTNGVPSNGAPAPVAMDDSTPRGALKVLLAAMQAADSEKLHVLLVARSPLEERMVDAIAKRADAEKRFRAAVEKAYGAAGARALVNDSEAQTAAGMAQLDAADERIEGPVAYVAAGAGSDMRLVRVDGRWRVPVSQFAASPAEKEAAAAQPAQQPPADQRAGEQSAAGQNPGGQNPAAQNPAGQNPGGQGASASTAPTTNDGIAGKEKAIEERLDDEKIALRVIDEMTDEINAGKYKSPQEAADAIRMKSMVEMMRRGAPPAQPSPATQPATQPSRT